MAQVKRFYYVSSPRGRVVHMARSITEGTRTFCGIMLPHKKRWKWARSRIAKANAQQSKICKKCQRNG
jgi:hypothetical protein